MFGSNGVGRILLLAGLCVFVLATLAGPSAADCEVSGAREFSGEVQKISKKFVIVDNRMGDKIKFEYNAEKTKVSGEADNWKGIKRKQWATVCSRMLDKPRVAYSVTVAPPKKDD